MLKAELHTHTSDDPRDYIPHSTFELIDRCAELGYHVLALTLHDRCLDLSGFVEYARARKVMLIDGVERAIRRQHVLLLNFGASAERVDSFEALADLRRSHPSGLVIAPHPFYPGRSCVGRTLERHPDLFDAVEFNAFYTARINSFNAAAVRWARNHAKPVVANADVHRLRQLGRTYTLVDAAPTPDAVCAAIRAGRLEIRTEPLTVREAIVHLADLGRAEFRRPANPIGSPERRKTTLAEFSQR